MKETLAIKIEDNTISTSMTIIPPFTDDHSLVNVKKILITPINIVYQAEKPFLALISGTILDSGEEVVSTNFCIDHSFYDKKIVGWKITPLLTTELFSPSDVLREKILYPLLSVVKDAIDKSSGETLVISRGGLSYAIYSKLATNKYSLYGGSNNVIFKGEPLISVDRLKKSSWDTVVILTIDKSLVMDTFSLINDTKKVLYSPMYRCIHQNLLVKCSNCSVEILSSRKEIDEGRVNRLDKFTIYKYIEDISVKDLPVIISKPYILVSLKD